MKLTVNGEEFDIVARMNSEDPSVKDNGGGLGDLTVFQTVYPFENHMYNTNQGQISDPFRTRFGFHILKVADYYEKCTFSQIQAITNACRLLGFAIFVL